MNNNKQIIGLIGGMGPFASAEFCKLLLQKSSTNFGAINCDDFPEIVLDSIPVPDFISDTKRLAEARKMLVSRIKKLNDFGCTSIAMVCNTGHVLFPELSSLSKTKMVSLINSVRDRVVAKKFKKVGLLATKTTIRTDLFKKAFLNTSIDIIIPDNKTIEICEGVIRDVIANNISNRSVNKLVKTTREFIKDEGLDCVILGCTELPLAFPKNKIPNVVDCLDVLSDKLLEEFFKEKNKNEGN